MANIKETQSSIACYNPDRGWKLLAFGRRHHACFLYRDVESDRNWVKVTIEILERAGFICWYRNRDFVAGQTYATTVIQSLEQSVKIVVILSTAFVESPRCKYDLDLALEECLNRGEDGETGVLIPVALESCVIPKILRPLHVLDIQEHEQDWLSILARAIESNNKFSSFTSECNNEPTNEIEAVALQFSQKLQTASVQDIFTFLSKPIAHNLSHFLSQHSDIRFFVSAMDTCGVEIKDCKVSFELKTFSQYTSKPYQIAHCFNQYAHKLSKNIKEVDLVIHEPSNVLRRDKDDEIKEFNELIRSVLKPPKCQLWGIMWNMTGIQTKAVRDECRSLIHDALIGGSELITLLNPSYVSLNARVDSFINWPAEKQPTKEKLAEAGYFFDTANNILRCFYCDGVSWDLKPNEDPWIRHAKWYFNCPYILASKTKEFIENCRFDRLKRSAIYNIDYNKFELRLRSYIKWPVETCPKPEVMSKAGFYFTHVEDKVVCYHCGYGVRNWQKDDNPWYRHAWWSPDCAYLFRYKSTSFIDNVLSDRAKLEPLDRCILTYRVNAREHRK